MLNQFKLMGALGALMKNPDAIKDAGRRVKDEAESMRVTGEAGGGAVRATVTGRMELVELHLEPALAGAMGEDGSREQAQELVVQAVSAAQVAAQGRMRELLQREAAELGFDELPPELAGLLGS